MPTLLTLLELFKNNGQHVTFKKRALIVSQSSSMEYAYLITKGYVKEYDIDQDGTERITSIFVPCHMFPVTWLIWPPSPEALYFYAAMTPVECYRMPIADLEELLRNDPTACRFLVNILVKSYVNRTSRIQNLQSPHAAERVHFILHYLAQRLGVVEHNTATIPAIITHQEIADLSGVARETVTIELRRLAEQGIYQRNDGVMHINLDKLNTKAMPKIFGMQCAIKIDDLN